MTSHSETARGAGQGCGEADLLPCPLCGKALESVWGQGNPGYPAHIIGMRHPYRPEDGLVCALQYHVVWPAFYGLWNTRAAAPSSMADGRTG